MPESGAETSPAAAKKITEDNTEDNTEINSGETTEETTEETTGETTGEISTAFPRTAGATAGATAAAAGPADQGALPSPPQTIVKKTKAPESAKSSWREPHPGQGSRVLGLPKGMDRPWHLQWHKPYAAAPKIPEAYPTKFSPSWGRTSWLVA